MGLVNPIDEAKSYPFMSVLPHKDFVIETMKQEITRKEDHLKNLLLNIDVDESSMTSEAAEEHSVLIQLRDSYMDRSIVLARKGTDQESSNSSFLLLFKP